VAASQMTTAADLFEQALEWLRQNYSALRFFVERDVVWTVQSRIAQQIAQAQLPYKVFNDHPVLPGNRRHIAADIAILDAKTGALEVVAEFKYEPSHQRTDILEQKLPVVFWRQGVIEDTARIRQFVQQGGARVAFAVFIDEGGYFRNHTPPPASEWKDWGNGTWVLHTRATP